ncbi:unnamed protein product [Porites evermanni]|uniref:Caspase family p20 domain-containing protein n=1 Tax=Porites evermanni TaxID=104178 RepID=A0ABN8QEQ4_9CNID|nr:unnamed protein product [Porites evermanni]
MATGSSPSAADEALSTTDEKANFQRLTRLLMRGGLALLREVLDSIHPPANLPAVLSNPVMKTQLQTLRRNKVLTHPEWNCLYNPSGPGTYGKSTDFDISLLCKLLRAICSLTPPATGWDILPNSIDHSLEADLVRIKFYRNKIYGHNHSMEISNADFEKLWMEISEALLRIAGRISSVKRDEWKKSIETFFHEPLTPDAKKCVDELRLWYLMDMDTKDKLEKLDEKVEQMEIRHEQRHMEILIILESLKANGPVDSSSPQVESAQLPSERLETRIPIPPEQPSAESAASLSTLTELQASQQNRPAVLDFWYVVYSLKSSLNLFLTYLKMKLGVNVEDYRLGSLVLTVSCSSLEVLEALWKEYRTGHLNKVVQAILVTAEVLEKLDLNEVKLRTLISEEDYLSYKDFLNYRPGKTETKTSQEPAVFASKLPAVIGKEKMTIRQAQRRSPAIIELVKVKKSVKRGVRVLRARSTRASHVSPQSRSLLLRRRLHFMLYRGKSHMGKVSQLGSSLKGKLEILSFHLRYTGKGKMTIRQAQRRSPAIMELVEGKIKRRSVSGLNVVGGKTVSTTSRTEPTTAEFLAGLTHGKPSQEVKGDYIARSGYVLIINNDPTPTASYSFESEKQAFADGFRFTTRGDNYLTTSDMLKALTDTAQRDFSSNDCFCCIIRSTGTEHGICGTDDKPIDIKTITSLFTSDKCPSLDGKPKIFVLEPKYQSRAFSLLKYERDIEARSMLRHLVISEKDFLVWNHFAAVPPYYMSFLIGNDWLEGLSMGMHLREAIAAVTGGNEQPLSLLSTLEKNVFFKRNTVV